MSSQNQQNPGIGNNSIQANWMTGNFGCFLNSPSKNEKQIQLEQGKSVPKCLQICTCRFLGMPIAMHYVRTLCDKYFLSYYGFSAFYWKV